ncbi:MAG: hypothetical protein AMXMBFR59_38570 [Rhodanobacteraceae bacterium]
MDTEQQNMPAIREPKEMPTNQRPARQVEGLVSSFVHQSLKCHFRIGVTPQIMIDHRKSAFCRRSDPLDGPSIHIVECGAKYLVSLDDPIQSSPKGDAVQLAGKIHPAMRSVSVSNSTQLIQEPESLLRKRHDPFFSCDALSDLHRQIHLVEFIRLQSRYGPVGIES